MGGRRGSARPPQRPDTLADIISAPPEGHRARAPQGAGPLGARPRCALVPEQGGAAATNSSCWGATAAREAVAAAVARASPGANHTALARDAAHRRAVPPPPPRLIPCCATRPAPSSGDAPGGARGRRRGSTARWDTASPAPSAASLRRRACPRAPNPAAPRAPGYLAPVCDAESSSGRSRQRAVFRSRERKCVVCALTRALRRSVSARPATPSAASARCKPSAPPASCARARPPLDSGGARRGALANAGVLC